MTSTNDIRQSFLDFFAGKGHKAIASAPLIPQADPTLMFVNAGMVPFKNVFTGLESAPAPCATSSQKCVRAGGKHNDLDNVGYTARHHTFFEMLGNFSFGDYFKEDAISHAWELLTKVWGIAADKLTVTVYHDDDEAFALWQRISGLPDERIIRIATDDNFWSMGDTGPCGPCSEIFYDHGDHIPGGPPGSPDEDGDRFVEIWNLVFMQYDRDADGTLNPLPKPSIDTGMGLERIAAVLQGTHDNYRTDTFEELISASVRLTGSDDADNAGHRIIADHLRSTSFLIADGVLPANEGRGYVLRRIMRRAMRHAHLLGASEPLMHRLVPTLVSQMGQAYPELARAQPLIAETLEREEIRFRKTLDKGLKLLDEAVADLKAGDTLPGQTAFKLYDTYGFPYDLTEDALRAQDISVDRAGFDAAMAEQKAAARAAWKGSGETASDDIWFDIAEREGSTEFTGYTALRGDGVVVALIRDGAEVDALKADDSGILLTNQTPFYGESGGQEGDSGTVLSGDNQIASVETVSKPLGRLHAHHITMTDGALTTGDTVTLRVDGGRRDRLRANHSATHLLHAALRRHLGEHVTQKGSLVAEDRLRFDFSHPKAVTPEEIAAIQAEVNAQIRGNDAVQTRLMAPDDAVAAGALALFGEKYGDEVRVLSMGAWDDSDYSVELCGGTHVNALGDIGLLHIASESAVSGGVRRIEALTGEAARDWLVQRDHALQEAASALKTSPAEVTERVAALVQERKKLEQELAESRKKLALAGNAGGGDDKPAADESIGDVRFRGQCFDGLNPKELRGLLDNAKADLGSGVAVMIAVNDGRAAAAVGVTDDLVESHSAVDLVRVAVEALGGKGGGGRPDMAQGGGPNGDAADDALAAVRAAIAG
ncbi:alanine--tRNA ligase [Alterisphingorhabdus coralli]|uniref:Alanine--tRNA ligase n=1 Tax=Alterisphingorhabdus coralli TaxID=3071408 RepID=A0AA97I0K2_9SPHN|nr:alanine--tRNA ligase [Parasphingorhabdus sp. SCSIO 66989]WOE74463.1 alanine--tRNA ligase [Parasphingorhabdus sp. SCSIO 66989]